MIAEEVIKKQILKLFNENPLIHMNVSLSRPRLVLENAEARITGVYPHIFQIEENSLGYTRLHSLKYTELMIGNIVIKELF